ncbi:MAG TPA: hypothetical protein VHQ66_16460 [Myxococcota bacterium]|jgi:hypothetical protein|nr:hypothetical protein [Myxococcota bacterium]
MAAKKARKSGKSAKKGAAKPAKKTASRAAAKPARASAPKSGAGVVYSDLRRDALAWQLKKLR